MKMNVENELDKVVKILKEKGFVHRKIRESYGRTLLQQVCP